MKSNNEHINPGHVRNLTELQSSIQKEKEELVSLFLSNASLVELSERFKRIDELNEMISARNISD